ncbi:MAG TPA: MFS transporter [Usitatibacter sp.]|nr:MFS transporter [Usitatibacter sp.]
MSASPAASPPAPGRAGDTAWLAWLCASRMSFGFIFMAYSGAVPVLMREWHMSAGEAGLVHTGWHAGYLVSLFAVGFLTDRFGAKRVFLATSWAACASAALFATFADGFRSALVLYSLTGLCSGGSYTPGLALISQRFAPRRRGGAMGWYLAASSLGYAISLFAGSVLIALEGWRAFFYAAAAGPVLGMVIAHRVLRDSRNIVAVRHAGAGVLLSLVEVIRNKPAMLAIWAYAFHSWELLGLWAWLPTYLAAAATRDHGVAAAASIGALLSGVSFATNAVGSVVGGRLSDRFGRTAVMLLMTATSLFCSFTFGWLFSAPLWFLAGVAIAYNLSALGDSSVYSTALTELVPARYLGAAYSLRAVLGFGLGAVSPAVFGLVLDYATRASGERGTLAWGAAWLVLGAGALPGVLAIARLRRASAPPR